MIGAMFFAPVSAVHATTVDFTDEAWAGVNNDTSYSAIGTGITLSSNGIDMTFNGGGDAQGCVSASGSTGLVCDGDGIGIGNDEITEGGNQILTVTFDNGPVNVHAIHLLDLFSPATESTGEIAVIKWNSGLNEYEAHAIVGPFNGGGYWEVNEGPSVYDGELLMAGITSFTLEGSADDGFSDYALARIEYSAVPIPAPFWLFGTALIGFVAMSRRTKV